MQTLRFYLKIYGLIVSQYIKARLQYRVDFALTSVGIIATSIAGLFVFWVLFQTIPTLEGWNFEEMMFMYGFYLIAISPVQIFFDSLWSLRHKIADGTFIKYYFKPLNMMFYYMSEVFDIKGITQLILGICVFVYASIQLGLDWTLFNVVLLLISLFSASLVTISMLIISASSSFWIINSFPVISLAWRLREFSPYPMTIFDGFFRFLFTFLIPIGFVAFYPAQLFLRTGNVSILVYISPFIGLAFFAIAYGVWHRGVNIYNATGS